MIDPGFTPVLVFVLACWLVYFSVFVFRRRSQWAPQEERLNRSFWGVLLVGIGFGLVWSLRRPVGTPFLDLGRPVEFAADVVAVAIAAASVWLTLAAVRTLGRQWNIRAALVEGHRLIKSGPYS